MGKPYRNLLLISFSFLFYLGAMILFKLDKDFIYKWYALFLSLLPLLITSSFWLTSLITHKKVLKIISPHGLIVIFILALLSRLILLTDYPFVSIGDEIRDGGLNALEIQTGQIKDIFGYGRYGAHGLIIPTTTSFFYNLIGSSVLIYRFPAAIISILDIIIFYLLLSILTKNKIASFLGAMVLISLPLHLFYSRTEIVVILSSLLATITLFGLFVLFKRKMTNLADYIFLGTLLGFTFNFHGAIKAFALIILATIILISFYLWFSKRLKTSQFGIRLLFLIFCLFIGFGPRLLNTFSPNLFFNTSRLPLVNEGQTNTKSDGILNIAEKYQKSLLVWITEPTTSWYPDHKSIFPPLLFCLMLIGIIASFIKRNKFLITIFFTLLILHLSNSALTDIINGDHRLAPAYPIGCLFVTIGITHILKTLKSKNLRYLISTFLFIFLSYQLISFFTLQPANKNKDVGDYLSMHTIYFIKENKDLLRSNNLIFLVSPTNYQKFNYLHYKEQYNFFLPTMNVAIEENANIKDNEIYIKNNKYDFLGKRYAINCDSPDYYCPIGYKNNIVINY